jgi:pyruvate dehydrogenase E2 component (dihydrolipoamide acetyltransferase)
MTVFCLPDLGEGLQEAEIVAWHVAPGERVAADQPLVSVETAKAVVEIPAPQSGRIARLHGKPGQTVEVGKPLVEFGEGPAEHTGARDGGHEEQTQAAAPRPSAPSQVPGGKATPAVRARARELGIDLAQVKGSGPGGTVAMRDLEGGAPAEPKSGETLSPSRRTMARNMARAHAEVAAATLTEEADVSHWPKGEDITIRLVRALVAACKAEPRLNGWYDAAADALTVHEEIRLGVAQDTPDGLFVPVLRDLGRPEGDLRAELERLMQAVASRTAEPRDLTGQTITLSNFGAIAGIHATVMVLPPQVAILGAGRILARAIVAEGELRAGRIMPLSLTVDHRAITGGEAARFLTAVVKHLQG